MGSINSLTRNLSVDFKSLKEVANGTYNKGEINVVLKHGRLAFDKINNHVKNTEENNKVFTADQNKTTNAAVFKAILEHYGRNDALVAQVKAADIENCEYLLDSFSNPFIKKAFEFLIANDLKDGKPLSRDEMRLLFDMLDAVDRDLVTGRNNLIKFSSDNYRGNEKMQLLRDVHTFKTTGQFNAEREEQIKNAIKGFRATNANSSRRNAIMAVSVNQRTANPVADANANPVNRQLGNTGANLLQEDDHANTNLLQESAALESASDKTDSTKPDGQTVFDDLITSLKAANTKTEKVGVARQKLTSFVKTLYGDYGERQSSFSASFGDAALAIGLAVGTKYKKGTAPSTVISGMAKIQSGFEQIYEFLDKLEKNSPEEGKAERQKLIAEFKEAQMTKSPTFQNSLQAAEAMGQVFADKCTRVNGDQYGKEILENFLKDMFSQLFGKHMQNAGNAARAALQEVQQDMPNLAKELREAQAETGKKEKTEKTEAVATKLWTAFNKCLKFQTDGEALISPSPDDWSAHKKDALFRKFLNCAFNFEPKGTPPEEKAALNLGKNHQVSYVRANAVERGDTGADVYVKIEPNAGDDEQLIPQDEGNNLGAKGTDKNDEYVKTEPNAGDDEQLIPQDEGNDLGAKGTDKNDEYAKIEPNADEDEQLIPQDEGNDLGAKGTDKNDEQLIKDESSVQEDSQLKEPLEEEIVIPKRQQPTDSTQNVQAVQGSQSVQNAQAVQGAQPKDLVASISRLIYDIADGDHEKALMKIAGYVQISAGEAPKGYLGLGAYGVPVKLLANDKELNDFNADTSPLSGDQVEFANAKTKHLRLALLEIADEFKLSGETMDKIQTLLTPENRRGALLISCENVAKAINEILAGTKDADQVKKFWGDVTPAGDYKDTSLEHGIRIEKLITNHGFAAFKEEMATSASNLDRVAVKLIKEMLADADLLQQLKNIGYKKTATKVEIEDVYDMSRVAKVNPFQQEAGGSTTVASNRSLAHGDEEEIVFGNFADASKAGGYWETANTQEEMTIRGYDLTYLPWLVANGLADAGKFRDEFKKAYSVGYRQEWGQPSPADGIVYPGAILRNDSGKVFDKPVKTTMLVGAADSETIIENSVDLGGSNHSLLRNRIETRKEARLVELFKLDENGRISEEAKAAQKRSYNFIAKCYTDLYKHYEQAEFRKVMHAMLYSGANAFFDPFGADTDTEVENFKAYIGFEQEKLPARKDAAEQALATLTANYWSLRKSLSEASEEDKVMLRLQIAGVNQEIGKLTTEIDDLERKIPLYAAGREQFNKDAEQTHDSYMKSQVRKFLTWFKKAAMSTTKGKRCVVSIGNVGMGAFNGKVSDVALCLAEAAILAGQDAGYLYPNYKNSEFEPVMRAAFVKMSALYGIPWWKEGEDANSMTLEDAEKALDMADKFPNVNGHWQTDDDDNSIYYKPNPGTSPKRFNEADKAILQKWRSEMKHPHLDELRVRWNAFDADLEKTFND